MLANALPSAFSILANSRYTAAALSILYPACANSVQITWVGVDPGFFNVKRAPRNKVPQLLTVSRLSEPRKNVDLVLHALAGIKDRFDFEYIVAGDGLLRPGLERLAANLGLGQRVRFVGQVSDADLRDLYAHADLLILPASIKPDSHEGFGIVYLEAAACGVPSLAARLAGAAEAVDEGSSGFFVDTPDVPSIHDALARYLGGEIRFDADTCRNFARSFSWTRIADVCDATYRQAAMREFRP